MCNLSRVVVGWLWPATKYPPRCSHSLLPAAAEQGREEKGQKWEKCESQDKDSLITSWKKKGKQGMQGQSLGVSHEMPNQCPSSSYSEYAPSFYFWAWRCMAWNAPLDNSGQLSRRCPLPTSSLPAVYALERQSENQSLDAGQSLSAVAKTPTCFTQRCKAQHHRGSYEES